MSPKIFMGDVHCLAMSPNECARVHCNLLQYRTSSEWPAGALR